MDFSSILNKNEPHQRTIVHLDMDYFYAQVEEIRDPSLRTQAVGVQQKNIVVTCNYIAREVGVKKLMLVSEAKRLCPTLVLVNGEDLRPYRQMSQQIFELLHDYVPAVEKLGFDENFMDISDLVDQRLKGLATTLTTDLMSEDTVNLNDKIQIVGNIYPNDGTPSTLFTCTCGCAQRLAIATQIAKEIRDDLYKKLNITCCAGISYNKLLAKLVGSQNKPNQQTVLASSYAEQFMRELKNLNRITGIGQKTQSLLLESGITNVQELQRCEMDFLRKKFGFETATKLKDLSFGRDASTIRPTGKPKTIGLEDSCRPLSVRAEVEERLRLLLMRLMEQVAEDGRIPIAIKVILRKYDAQKKTSHRETKQANILPSLFKTTNNNAGNAGGTKVILAEGGQEKLIKIIMRLFERVVDLSKPFNITLIGLAFSKFQQRKVGSSSIANFLIKKADLEVQSITSLTNTSSEANMKPTENMIVNAQNTNDEDAFRSSPTTFQPSDQFYRRRTTAASPIPMLTDNGSESGATNSDFSDFSETEIEPSPKKSRVSRLMAAKRRCLGSTAIYNNETAEIASPSKLRVCDLRLNSRDSEKDFQIGPITTPTTTASLPMQTTTISSVPLLNQFENSNQNDEISQQTLNNLTTNEFNSCLSLNQPSILVSPSSLSSAVTAMDESNSNCVLPTTSPSNLQSPSTLATTSTTTITGNLSNIPCPPGVDPQVFNELPVTVQNELISSWRSSLAAAAVAVVNDVTHSTLSSITPTNHQGNNHSTTKAGGPPSNTTQKNTLYRYFLRNK